jgi:hypothetical protein
MKNWYKNWIKRIKNWWEENPIRRWIIICTIGILLIWLFIIYKYIELNHLTVFATAVLSLVFIIELFWYIIRNNVWFFFAKGNKSKTFILCIFIAAAVFIAYYVVYFLNGFVIAQNHLLAVSGIFLTIMGLFISVRVLMAVNKSQSVDISDWISLTTEIINEAEGSNIVYIIAPTFCAGLSNPKTAYLLDKLYEKIEQKRRKHVNFRCAFLKTNFNSLPNYTEWTDTTRCYLDAIIDDFHWNMYKEFRRAEHDKLDGTEKKVAFVKDIYTQLKNYYDRIQSVTDELHQLNNNYLVRTSGVHSFSGFFVTANISKGRYYLGTFNHDGIKTTFDGTEFLNRHIRTEMDEFIKRYISNNAYNANRQ